MATLRVTPVKSAIGIKPKQRGTFRALGLRKIDQTVELPDRPEIRGMVAKVPHLVRVESVGERIATIKIHDLKPAPGSKQAPRRVGRGIGGKGGKTAGRGRKGTGARGTVKPGFEGGQTPLHRRIPKAKGFRNPFRVEYHVVNLDTLEAFDAGATVDPDTLREHGLVAKRGLVKVLGRGEVSKALTVKAHAFSHRREAGDRRGRWNRRSDPGAVGRRTSARLEQRPDQPLRPGVRPASRCPG